MGTLHAARRRHPAVVAGWPASEDQTPHHGPLAGLLWYLAVNLYLLGRHLWRRVRTVDLSARPIYIFVDSFVELVLHLSLLSLLELHAFL